MSESHALSLALRKLNMQEVDGQRVFLNAPLNLGEYYRAALAEHADLPCLIDGSERLSYGQTFSRASAFSAALVDPHMLGMCPGDRVAICARNSNEWCLSFLGATAVGAVAVPMNSLWLPAELEYGLVDCGATVLVCDIERLARCALVMSSDRYDSGALTLRHIVLIKGVQSSGQALPVLPDHVKLWMWEDVIAGELEAGTPLPTHRADPEDTVMIMYTSGTTGFPKGMLPTLLEP